MNDNEDIFTNGPERGKDTRATAAKGSQKESDATMGENTEYPAGTSDMTQGKTAGYSEETAADVKEESINNSSASNSEYRQTGGTQYGRPQYSNPPYGTPRYGNPQYGNPQYGNPQYGNYQHVDPQYSSGNGYRPTPHHYQNDCPGGGYTPYGRNDYPPQGNTYTATYGHPYGTYSGTPYPVWQTRPGESPEEQNEKRNIKSLANGIGLSLSMQFFITEAVVLLLISILGTGNYRALFSDSNFCYVFNSFLSILIMTVPFLFVTKFTGYKWHELFDIKRPVKGSLLPVVMLGLGVCAISNYASSVISVIIETFFGTEVKGASPDYGTDTYSFLITLLCVGIVPAVIEEFAFRGIVLGALRKYVSDGMAILVSAALFGLVHGNLQQIPFAFGVGLILAYATVYTGSLIPGMIIHFLNNSFTVILSFATAGLSPQVYSLIYWLYFLTLLLIGICGLIMLIKTDKNSFRLSSHNSEKTVRNMKWFCSSGWIIGFFAICVFEVLSLQLS